MLQKGGFETRSKSIARVLSNVATREPTPPPTWSLAQHADSPSKSGLSLSCTSAVLRQLPQMELAVSRRG
ncbi:uncharacterized protein CCOS01_10505 [Colletotrichum costaricense]|uniref:Uncharacterized protein n=1 Tax=Colletotrichum costaricense TaxID=1209916 RepID=A0AAJ0DY83_9PEZI|nr:uncharacterized protein CCOS01_10505 [Colletotrichum costaricense]KAK1520386.1 hypothetical protein CCOS01_10505 [Colletotrichum costaricense]